MPRYTTDRIGPSLIAFYDIRPGNGASLFLQPRNPHGVSRNVGRRMVVARSNCSRVVVVTAALAA